jgi:hypothetical protein
MISLVMSHGRKYMCTTSLVIRCHTEEMCRQSVYHSLCHTEENMCMILLVIRCHTEEICGQSEWYHSLCHTEENICVWHHSLWDVAKKKCVGYVNVFTRYECQTEENVCAWHHLLGHTAEICRQSEWYRSLCHTEKMCRLHKWFRSLWMSDGRKYMCMTSLIMRCHAEEMCQRVAAFIMLVCYTHALSMIFLLSIVQGHAPVLKVGRHLTTYSCRD